MNERELDLALGAIGASRTRVIAPAALRGRVRAVPTQAHHQRSWLPLAGRFPSMFSATKFVVAGVVVALFGGFLLTGILTTQPSDEQAPAAVSTAATEPDASEVASPTTQATNAPESATTTIPPIELPAEIPDDIESGTLETPLGPARWVHLSGDRANLAPEIRDVVSTPEGFMLESSGATLWRSPDLLTWTSQSLDLPDGQLSYTTDGTYWLKSGNVWWRSQDAESWEQVDFGVLAPPQRDGYAYALHLHGPPLEHGGVTIAPYGWGASHGVVTRDHPLAEQAYGLSEIEPGVYKLGLRRDTVPTVRFEEIEGGVRMIDHEDGTELKVLDGISMEFIERLGSDEGIPVIPGLVIVDGDELVDVELPEDMRRADELVFSTDGPEFTAYGLSGGLLTVHRSQDGRDWRQTDIIGDDVGEPTDVAHFDPRTNATTAVSTDGTRWTTTDGQQWKELPRPPQGNAHRFAAGWIRTTNRFPMWYHPDRGKVVRIDHSAMALPPKSECAGSPQPISSNTLYMSCKRKGVRDTWIITFDDVPADDPGGV